MHLLRLSAAALSLSAIAACTINPRPVVVTMPPAVVAPAPAAVPAPTAAVVPGPGSVVMGAPAAIEIPSGAYPGPGNCRIWIPGVALSQQQPAGPCPDLQDRVPPGAVFLRG